MDDSGYADACMQLEDEVSSAANRVSEVLTNKEIAEELRRIAKNIEEE